MNLKPVCLRSRNSRKRPCDDVIGQVFTLLYFEAQIAIHSVLLDEHNERTVQNAGTGESLRTGVRYGVCRALTIGQGRHWRSSQVVFQ
jgi:hypothetical protein